MIRRVCAGVVALALTFAAQPVAAHALSVFALVEDGHVLVEARFADGSPVAAGVMRVLDSGGQVILSAPLDAVYPDTFPVGDHGDGLRIEVDAGGGHTGYWLLTPADLLEGADR